MKDSTTSAVIWSVLERLSTQIVSFLIGIILARLLTPHDYGIVGIAAIFIAVSNVFIDSGFGNAIVRKIDRTEADLATVFYFNIFSAFCIYVVLWFTSPVIASFFKEPLLIILVRVAGLAIIFNSLSIVQVSILTSRLDIKSQTIANLASQIPAGLLAVLCASKGLGVYSLVIQTVSAAFLKMISLWYYTKWAPKEPFNKTSFKYLWGFGSKILTASMIGVFFDQLYSILIGKYIGKNELGYYSKSAQLKDTINGISTGVINKISLPLLSQHINENNVLSLQYRRMMRMLVFFAAPISSILCFNSNDIIVLLWSDKWIDSAILFQLLIVGAMFAPIGQLSLILMQAVGRSDMVLKLELPKKILYCIIIGVGFYYGVIGLCVSIILISMSAAIINSIATRKIISYSYVTQILDLAIYMTSSYVISFLICLIRISSIPILNIMVCGMMTCIFYLVILLILKDEIAIHFLNVANNKYKIWKEK